MVIEEFVGFVVGVSEEWIVGSRDTVVVGVVVVGLVVETSMDGPDDGVENVGIIVGVPDESIVGVSEDTSDGFIVGLEFQKRTSLEFQRIRRIYTRTRRLYNPTSRQGGDVPIRRFIVPCAFRRQRLENLPFV